MDLLPLLVLSLSKLMLGILGFVACRYMLVWMDYVLRHTEFQRRINGWPHEAQATYYAGRLLACGLVIGFSLS